ncbi:MAG TPA: SDR family NAD(P)-dependent oxidoreductase [Gemmatimonadaceae bacterium]|nr:SDR family NAD(P)-dependent oxidoreductase [Gemmatimonadaceae bacterium]
MPYLTHKHAIITGGGRGIGAAIAAELARLGASVTIMGRRLSTLEVCAAEIAAEHRVRVLPVVCDVSDEASIDAAFARAIDALGDAYVLVNNAGQAGAKSLVEGDRVMWDQMMAVNLTGPYLCARAVLPAMLVAEAGRIINIASTAGVRGYAKLTAYCASKHGVIGLTRALAHETAKQGVTVNAVCPGYTENTSMVRQGVEALMQNLDKTEEEATQMLLRNSPRRAFVRPAEVANAVAWLCSPDATAVTGQAIAVAGGEVM